ncbi:MAG: MCE family protein, partial [Calditrichaeota bacterium]
MESRSLELKVGLVAITGILILVLATIWGKNVRIGAGYRTLQVVFTNSGGLRPGDPVTVNGVKKGRIEAVELHGNRVLVTARLAPDVQLYSDARCRIAMVDLMGANKLEIYPGDSGVALDLDDHPAPLIGSEVASIDQMMSELLLLKERVDTLLVELQESVNTLSLLLDEEKTVEPIHRTLHNLEASSRGWQALLQEQAPVLRASLQNLQEISAELHSLLQAHGPDVRRSLAQVPDLVQRLDRFSRTLEKVSEQVENRRGTLGKLVYDDSTYVA